MTTVKVLQKGFPGKTTIALLYLSSITYIEHDGLKIICDVGPISIRKNLIKTMAEQNIDPGEIDYVFISHLHHDHAANIDLFKNATVVLSKTEWEYAHKGSDQAIQMAYLPQYEKAEKLFVTENGQTVVPGIKAWLVPGHTPGSICFSLNVNGECWVIAGDAVKNRVELETGEVALTLDPIRSKESIGFIKNLADVVVPGHDCLLGISGGKAVALEENELTLVFPEGMTVNGSNPLIIKVDP